MGEVISIDKGKFQEFRRCREALKEVESKILELMRVLPKLYDEVPYFKEIDSMLLTITIMDVFRDMMQHVYQIRNKRVCGDCLTNEEILQILENQKSDDFLSDPRPIENPKLLKCSRCKKECD